VEFLLANFLKFVAESFDGFAAVAAAMEFEMKGLTAGAGAGAVAAIRVPMLMQTTFKVLVQEEDHLPAILFAIS
jgi:hypothetical protein